MHHKWCHHQQLYCPLQVVRMHGYSLCHFPWFSINLPQVSSKDVPMHHGRTNVGTSNLAQLPRSRIRKRNLEVRNVSVWFLFSLLSEVFDFDPTCFTLASCNLAHGITVWKQLQLRFFSFCILTYAYPPWLRSVPMEVLIEGGRGRVPQLQ